MTRIVILSSARQMAVQIAQQLAKYGHAADLLDVRTLDVPAPSSTPELRLKATAAPAGKTHKGKRIAQWKQERTDR